MGAGGGAEQRLVADGLAEVVLDRPEAMNALNTASLEFLAEQFTVLGADPMIRAVVLSAAGERAFCVGADLKERAAMSEAQIMAQRPVFRAAFGALLALPQPAIAAVHGFALGGGCELALSCDVIVADETAIFGLPEATVGLVPGCGGTQLLGAADRTRPGRRPDLLRPEGRRGRGARDRAGRPGGSRRDRAGAGARAGAADRGELAGRRPGGQAGAAERRRARPGCRPGRRGRRLAYRSGVGRPARGHRRVRARNGARTGPVLNELAA